VLHFHTFNTSFCAETRFRQIWIRICIVGMIAVERRKHIKRRILRGLLSIVSICYIRGENIDFVVLSAP
jgi:hypothetical protein